MRLRSLFRAGYDVDAARRFYGELLELPLEAGRRELKVAAGALTLKLHPALTDQEQAEWGLPAEVEVLAFEVDDLDALHARLEEAQVEIPVPPRPSPWGGRIMLARDPAGRLLELQGP